MEESGFRIEILKPQLSAQASFYNKAFVYRFFDGLTLLKSYNTIVAGIDKYGGKYRYFAGKSATTMRHVYEFFAQYAHCEVLGRDFKKWPVSNNPHSEIEEEQ